MAASIELDGVRYVLDDGETNVLIHELQQLGADDAFAALALTGELERSRGELGYHVEPDENTLPVLYKALAVMDKQAGPWPNATRLRLVLRDRFGD